MNEHLTKPIRRHVLEAALQRYLAGRKSGDREKPVLCARTWSDLNSDMPAEAVKKLASTFMSNQARELEAMRADIESGDRDTLCRRAHSLKGSARLLGATALGEAAMALEEATPEMDLEAAAKRLSELDQLFAEACKALNAKFASRSVAA